uniref:Uncharacterized protein n=1 Tax=Fusarium oxysporum (strain Fo5176) TaxID=660025 RepID=A0A0D2Y2B4_FUSOF
MVCCNYNSFSSDFLCRCSSAFGTVCITGQKLHICSERARSIENYRYLSISPTPKLYWTCYSHDIQRGAAW